MSHGSTQRRERWAFALLATGLVAIGCRGILGVDDLPPDGPATDAGNAADGGDEASTGGDSGVEPADPSWAGWPIPPDVRPMQYETSAGIAQDKITRLVWQRASNAPASWADARDACAALELAGRSGWRLPTRIELLSIIDYERPLAGNPFPDYFANPDWNCYWTISGETDETSHWVLETNTATLGVSRRDDIRCVSRCVDGAPPYDFKRNVPPAYVIEGGTVRDPLPRLEWQAYESARAGQLVTLEEGEATCKALRLAGREDWRLPTVKELESLVDERRILPSLDARVAGERNVYWTTTLHEPSPFAPDAGADGGTGRLAWRVSFTDGTTIPSDDPAPFPAGRALVRCVRTF